MILQLQHQKNINCPSQDTTTYPSSIGSSRTSPQNNGVIRSTQENTLQILVIFPLVQPHPFCQVENLSKNEEVLICRLFALLSLSLGKFKELLMIMAFTSTQKEWERQKGWKQGPEKRGDGVGGWE